MESTAAILYAVVLAELFALLHHGSLWARNRFTLKRTGSSLGTRQWNLILLQAVAWTVVVIALALRVARHLDSAIIVWYGWMLFAMIFAAGVYWRYPEAAPIAISEPDWTSGYPGASNLRVMRIPLAVLASFMAVVCFVILAGASG